MRAPNPFRPGFNQMPAVLAGREEVLAAVEEALDVAALDARTPRPLILTGTRGVGKTVVLDQVRTLAAEKYSWLTATVEVQPARSALPALHPAIAQVGRVYAQHPPGRGQWKLTKTTLKAGAAGITRTDPQPAPTSLRDALTDAMEHALALQAGIVLTVDEAHLAGKDDLAEVAALLQYAVGQDWPLVAVLAGLPSIQSPQRMVTYLERAEWHTLGLLTDAEARTALIEPARAAGRPMEPAAADTLTAAAGGYPYAIQVVGHHAWRRSHGQPTITAAAAAQALPDADRDLATGLYAARWNDASPKEREYLRALARLLADGQHPTGADVADALNQPAKALSYLRERLLRKGTVYTEGRALRLAVPSMARWLLDQER